MNLKNWTGVFSLALVASLLSVSAFAEGKGEWKKNHPRRAEVNGRLKNQNKRIKEGVEDGKITKEQAAELHKEDRHIRKEERAMAAKNGGHITKAEQRKLNRQENKVSMEIYQEKHETPAAAPAAPTPTAQ